MSSNITITVTPQRRNPVVMPQHVQQATQPKTQPQPIPQDRVTVRPRFMGDSFVYVPERVPTVNEDGTPIPSPTERLLNWLFGTG